MLHTLPSELIEMVLGRCSFINILNVSETCKKLRNLISKSSTLQLHIELEANNFEIRESASRIGLRSAELLERLKRVRDRWLDLDIRKSACLEVPKPMESIEECAPRLGYIPPNPDWRRDSLTTFHAFDFATHQIRTVEPGFLFTKSSADVSQDLLVLISSGTSRGNCTVHLCTYTDGSPHPLARLSVWEVQLPSSLSLCERAIRIKFLDDLLAIGFPNYDDQNEILIWNWKSGALLNRISIEGACSFGFITSDYVSVFNCTNQWETDHSIGLFIYNNVREPLASTSLSPTDKFVVTSYAPSSPSVEFCFPSRKAGLSAITLHSTSSQRNPPASSPSVFRISQEASILQLTLTFYQDEELDDASPLDVYDIFVSRSKLLACITDPVPSNGNLRRIYWDEWIEDCTRWFRSESSLSFESSRWVVEGSRAIGTNTLERQLYTGPNFDYMTLLDFHLPTIRRFSTSWDVDISSIIRGDIYAEHIDLDRSRRSQSNFFKGHYSVFFDIIDENNPTFTKDFEEGTIVSRLSYHMVTRRVPSGPWRRWALDEDRIVEIPADSREEADGKLNLRFYPME